MSVKRSSLLVFALVAATLAPSMAEACGARPYGAVSDWLEAADDASRVGDFALALSYTNGAVDAASKVRSGLLAQCALELAHVKHDQAKRREAYVDENGRSPNSFAAALRIPMTFPKSFNCP